LPVAGKVKGGKYPTAQDGKGDHEGTTTAIETSTLGLEGKGHDGAPTG